MLFFVQFGNYVALDGTDTDPRLAANPVTFGKKGPSPIALHPAIIFDVLDGPDIFAVALDLVGLRDNGEGDVGHDIKGFGESD
jgi:hypothetical protein